MKIAALNTRIIFQRSHLHVDNIGNHIYVWEDYFSCYATIGGETGKEIDSIGVVREDETLYFTVRWCSELAKVDSLNFQIILNQDIYGIKYINPLGFKRKALKFKAVLKKR